MFLIQKEFYKKLIQIFKNLKKELLAKEKFKII